MTDYRAIEPDYGTREDFAAFLAAAHARGIKVIVDLVLNHTSNQHPWFKDAQTPGSAHDDWYVWATANPHYPGPSGQTAWHPLGDRWYYGVFSDTMPDLNLRNPAVTAELEDMARFWLQDMGVDGFRLDAAKHLIEDGEDQVNTPETLDWLAGFKASVDAAKPGSLLVGEVFDPATIAGRYVPRSTDLTFNFSLATGIRLALQEGRAAPLTTAFGDTIADWPPNQSATFLTNHDQDRIMSQLRGDLPSAKLAAFLLLTSPGVPFLYYGEEIGMLGTQARRADPDADAVVRRRACRGLLDRRAVGGRCQDDPSSDNVAAESGDPREPAVHVSRPRPRPVRQRRPAHRHDDPRRLGRGARVRLAADHAGPGAARRRERRRRARRHVRALARRRAAVRGRDGEGRGVGRRDRGPGVRGGRRAGGDGLGRARGLPARARAASAQRRAHLAGAGPMTARLGRRRSP